MCIVTLFFKVRLLGSMDGCGEAVDQRVDDRCSFRESLSRGPRNARDLRIVMITEASEDLRAALELKFLDVYDLLE